MLGSLLFVFSAISLAFHFLLFWAVGKKGRIWLYSHEKTSALFVVGTDVFMSLFIGAGNIAGMANLVGGVILALWILIGGQFCTKVTKVIWKRALWIFPVPHLVIVEGVRSK